MSTTNPLTLEEIRESLSLKFTKWKLRAEKEGESGFDEESDEDEDESAFVAAGGNSKDGAINVDDSDINLQIVRMKKRPKKKKWQKIQRQAFLLREVGS